MLRNAAKESPDHREEGGGLKENRPEKRAGIFAFGLGGETKENIWTPTCMTVYALRCLFFLVHFG